MHSLGRIVTTDYDTFRKLNNELLDSQRPEVAKIITDAVISVNP